MILKTSNASFRWKMHLWIAYCFKKKNYQVSKPLFLIHLFLGKEKLEVCCCQFKLYLFFFRSIYSVLGTEQTIFICMVDCGWRESNLPSLPRVLSWLVSFCVVRVIWLVRYLDKPPWRAVTWQTIILRNDNKSLFLIILM